MKIDIKISTPEPPPPPPGAPEPYRVLRVPTDGGTYMQLKDDWETAQWNFMPRSKARNYKSDPLWNALPATIPTDDIFQTLDRRWQLFYFELCRRNTFGTMSDAALLAAYKSTTRDAGGWRDRHTWNNVKDPPKVYTDYVLGLNLPPLPTNGDAAQKDLWSSGNMVKVIGSTATHYLVEAFNTRLPPPPAEEVWGKWWLVGFLTLSAYNWDTGERRRMRWPFFNGYGCPHIGVARDGVGRIPREWCRPVANGAEIGLYT